MITAQCSKHKPNCLLSSLSCICSHHSPATVSGFMSMAREKKIASVRSEEITQINDEAVPENTKKATKFGFAVFKCNSF